MIQVFRPKSIKSREKSFVALYTILAMGLGFFLAAFDVLAHALFLNDLGYKFLASSYIMSGAIGTVTTLLYSFFFRKIHVKTLSSIIFLLFTLLFGAFFILNILYPGSPYVAYSAMVLLFPANIHIVLSLWRIGRKLMYPRQSKEVMPRIRNYHLFGWILGAATVFGLLYLEDPYYNISVLLLGVLFFNWLIHLLLFGTHKRKRNIFHSGEEQFVPIAKRLFLFFSSPLSTWLFIFTFLSAVVLITIHFAFINVAILGFETILGLAKFYSIFLTLLMFFVFGVDRYLIRKILYSYDSPFSLILVPALMLLAVVLTIVGYLFFSKIKPTEHFTIYFLILAIAKVGIESTRMVIQVPAQRVLYQALDVRYKQVVYPRIEGTVVMVAVAIAGAVMLGITFLKFFTFNIIMYWTGLISAIWLFAGFKLIKQYQKSQEKNLEKLRFNRKSMQEGQDYSERLWKTLTGNDYKKIRFILDKISNLNPGLYESSLSALIGHHDREVRREIISRVVEERLVGLIPELKNSLKKTSDDKEVVEQVIKELKKMPVKGLSESEQKEILLSGSSEERMGLLQSLAHSGDESTINLLYELAKDFDPDIQGQALKFLARKDNIPFNYLLLDYLYQERFNANAMRIISKSGSDAVAHLDREQLMPRTPEIVNSRIVRLYGQIGTSESIEKLISGLTDQNRTMFSTSLQVLISAQFQAHPGNRYKLLSIIVKIVGQISHYLYYFSILDKHKKLRFLADLYREEINFHYDVLFKLLALVYNPNTIGALRDQSLLGSTSQVNNAIEMLDQFLDEDLKQIIYPLLENISVKKRLKRLEYYFAQPKTNIDEIIRHSLTSDYKSFSYYSRACTLLYILENNLKGFEEEVAFNAFHDEPIIGQTALFVLYHHYRDKYDAIISVEENNEEMIGRASGVTNLEKADLYISNYQQLKNNQLYNNLSENVKLRMAYTVKRVNAEEDQVINLQDYIRKYSLTIIDSAILTNSDPVLPEYRGITEIELLAEFGITEIHMQKNSTIWFFEKATLNELMVDNIDLADMYYSIIENLEVGGEE